MLSAKSSSLTSTSRVPSLNVRSTKSVSFKIEDKCLSGSNFGSVFDKSFEGCVPDTPDALLKVPEDGFSEPLAF